jgi:hypothetical protein
MDVTDDKIILICATGRSGSTTMQRIINTIPNSNICGENYGAINSLLEFYRRIKRTTVDYVPGHLKPASFEDIISKNVKPAWYNSYNYLQMVQMIRMMIINMFKKSATTNLWGFKEIRYDHGNINYIKDFKELFPKTKVIIQIRENLFIQSLSGWYKEDKQSIHLIKQNTKELVDFALTNKEWCYLNTFERMFNRTNLENIFSFIDCKEFYDESKITEVLNNNIKD